MDEDEEQDENEDGEFDDEDDEDYVPNRYSEDAPPPIEIDIDGLAERVVALPMPISRYDCPCGLEDGRIYGCRISTKSSVLGASVWITPLMKRTKALDR